MVFGYLNIFLIFSILIAIFYNLNMQPTTFNYNKLFNK